MNIYHDARDHTQDYARDRGLNPERHEPWFPCPKCHGWMMPLAKYRIEDEEFNPPSPEGH
jgi:hypothetical protein